MPQLLTISEVAELLRVSTRTVHEHTSRGTLPCVRIGRRVLFDPIAIQAWVAKQGQPATAEPAN